MSFDSDTGYRLLDAGRGERLEQWGPYRLRRPDPRAGMGRALPAEQWSQIHAQYLGEAGHGHWERLIPDLPERWTIAHGGITLVVKLAPFKHTGVFPEQADHWRWMAAVSADRPLRVLNLFAYTGGATMALARAGHHVTHVDASKPALTWARENAAANQLAPDAIRWIQDDALTFVRRELRRGKSYDAAILDPPAFGRTPDGRVIWTRRCLACPRPLRCEGHGRRPRRPLPAVGGGALGDAPVDLDVGVDGAVPSERARPTEGLLGVLFPHPLVVEQRA